LYNSHFRYRTVRHRILFHQWMFHKRCVLHEKKNEKIACEYGMAQQKFFHPYLSFKLIVPHLKKTFIFSQ
jgi:hypothetical protein